MGQKVYYTKHRNERLPNRIKFLCDLVQEDLGEDGECLCYQSEDIVCKSRSMHQCRQCKAKKMLLKFHLEVIDFLRKNYRDEDHL